MKDEPRYYVISNRGVAGGTVELKRTDPDVARFDVHLLRSIARVRCQVEEVYDKVKR